MFTKEYKGIRWGYAFMKSDTRLTKEERDEILDAAISISLSGEKKRDLRGKRYEGVVQTENKAGQVGCFCGIEYLATLDVGNIEEKVKVKFLIDERTNGRFTPSLN